MINLYFSTVRILAQRPTHVGLFVIAAVLLVIVTFMVKYYDKRT